MRELRTKLGVGRFRRDRRGAAAVEFALVGPLLILLVCGILSYGGVMWTAHTVQQLANDGARAAIAGLDDAERLTLARAAVEDSIEGMGPFERRRTGVAAERDGQTFTVRVVYDASGSPFWALHGLLPMPSSRVTRDAAIRVGGL